MKSVKADVWLAICVIAGALVYLYADSRLPTVSLGGPLGPKAFPALIGIGLVFSGLLLLRESWRKQREQQEKRTRAPAQREAAPVDVPPAPAAGAKSQPLALILIAMVIWTALYYFCFERVGYLIATTVFLLGLLTYFHRGHYIANCVIAVGFTLVIDLLFSHLLNVPMPAGLLSI